jgi:hypothetical protein
MLRLKKLVGELRMKMRDAIAFLNQIPLATHKIERLVLLGFGRGRR